MPSISPELQKIMDDFATKDLGGTAFVEAVNLKNTLSARCLSAIKTPVAIASMSAFLTLNACAHTPTTQPKEQTMNTTSTNQSETPHLTAEQATLTALRFIGSLRTAADLNPERFKEVTGVQLRSYPESEGRFVFGEGAADGWAYSMEIYKHFQQLFAFEFGFHQAEGGRENTPMTKICTVDLQRFQAEMLKMGFVHAYDTRVNIMNRVFKKGGWYVSVGYVGESEQNPDHLCISRVLAASTDR